MNIQSLLDKFNASGKKHGYKRLKESQLFFDVDYEVMEKTRDEFTKIYQDYCEQVKQICGNPIEKDISGWQFKGFKLTQNEKLADMLTLFNYKDCRFGVLIWQEDKELPIEVGFSAYNPNAKEVRKKRPKEDIVDFGYFSVFGNKHTLTSRDFQYKRINFDRNEIKLDLIQSTEDFGYELRSKNIWYGHFNLDSDLNKAIELFIKGINNFRIYPSDKWYNHTDENITDYLATGRAPMVDGLPHIGEDYEVWINEQFNLAYPQREFSVKTINSYEYSILEEDSVNQKLTNGRNTAQCLIHFKIDLTLVGEKGNEEAFLIDSKIPFRYISPFEGTKQPDKTMSFVEAIIDYKSHRLEHKTKTLQKCLNKGEKIPDVFYDNRKAIFHLIDSIHYISSTLRQEDTTYLSLVLDNIPKAQLKAIEPTTGLDAINYCEQKKAKLFADFLKTYTK